MSLQVTSKMEINLLDAKTRPQYVSEFVTKHRVPVIVASPEYIAPLIAHRGMMGGGHKIICALDFPKGANFAMDKLFRSNPDFVAADGFDILLSPGRTEIESRNEMKTIFEYLKAHRPLCDIRWCLKLHSGDLKEAEGILKNMKKYPPSQVRVDPHVEIVNVGIDKQQAAVDLIKAHVPYPVKLSSVSLEVMQHFVDKRPVKHFDVTMRQAEDIVRALKIVPKDLPPPVPKEQGPAVKKVGNIGRIRI